MFESLSNKVEKETPTQLFSCEYCELFKNTYSQVLNNRRGWNNRGRGGGELDGVEKIV